MNMSDQLYIGIDLGGTSIKVGICNEAGDLVAKFEGPTHAEEGPEKVADLMAAYSRVLVENTGLDWDKVSGVGAGIAGFMDLKNGIVKLGPNLKWYDVPIRDMLQQRLEKPVLIDNDANVAALGEAWAGAGKGIDNVVLFTLGTGVGGGIVMDGKVVTGQGSAGELGHINVVPDLEAIQCGCGQMGCVETVSSATGIVRMAEDAVQRGDKTTLALLEQITAKAVFDEARAGDEVANRIVQRAGYYLGRTLATVAVILNPQRFIIGGGVSRAGELLFQHVRENFAKYTPPAAQTNVDIVVATLGNDAGMIGAAGLHLQR
jgi:glucokinase